MKSEIVPTPQEKLTTLLKEKFVWTTGTTDYRHKFIRIDALKLVTQSRQSNIIYFPLEIVLDALRDYSDIWKAEKVSNSQTKITYLFH